MRISDWSSDVCSSDLHHNAGRERFDQHRDVEAEIDDRQIGNHAVGAQHPADRDPDHTRQTAQLQHRDRKSVVEGKSVSVRVDRGGRSVVKKKTTGSISTLNSLSNTISKQHKKN